MSSTGSTTTGGNIIEVIDFVVSDLSSDGSVHSCDVASDGDYGDERDGRNDNDNNKKKKSVGASLCGCIAPTYWLYSIGAAAAGNSADKPTKDEEDCDTEGLDDSRTQPLKGVDVGVDDDAEKEFDDRTSRLIDWNTEVLLQLIRKIESKRKNAAGSSSGRKQDKTTNSSSSCAEIERLEAEIGCSDTGNRSMVSNEVRDIVVLPKEDHAVDDREYKYIELDPAVVDQVRDLVRAIARTYNDNPVRTQHRLPITVLFVCVFVHSVFRCAVLTIRSIESRTNLRPCCYHLVHYYKTVPQLRARLARYDELLKAAEPDRCPHRGRD